MSRTILSQHLRNITGGIQPTNLSSFGVGGEQIYNFDTSFQYLLCYAHFYKLWGFSVDTQESENTNSMHLVVNGLYQGQYYKVSILNFVNHTRNASDIRAEYRLPKLDLQMFRHQDNSALNTSAPNLQIPLNDSTPRHFGTRQMGKAG